MNTKFTSSCLCYFYKILYIKPKLDYYKQKLFYIKYYLYYFTSYKLNIGQSSVIFKIFKNLVNNEKYNYVLSYRQIDRQIHIQIDIDIYLRKLFLK